MFVVASSSRSLYVFFDHLCQDCRVGGQPSLTALRFAPGPQHLPCSWGRLRRPRLAAGRRALGLWIGGPTKGITDARGAVGSREPPICVRLDRDAPILEIWLWKLAFRVPRIDSVLTAPSGICRALRLAVAPRAPCSARSCGRRRDHPPPLARRRRRERSANVDEASTCAWRGNDRGSDGAVDEALGLERARTPFEARARLRE